MTFNRNDTVRNLSGILRADSDISLAEEYVNDVYLPNENLNNAYIENDLRNLFQHAIALGVEKLVFDVTSLDNDGLGQSVLAYFGNGVFEFDMTRRKLTPTDLKIVFNYINTNGYGVNNFITRKGFTNDTPIIILEKREANVRKISKLLRSDLTDEEFDILNQEVYVPNESMIGQLTDVELDRILYHAYCLDANEVSFMTNEPVKFCISGYIFKATRRILTPSDISLINRRLYQANNADAILRQRQAIDCAYAVRLDKLPEDLRSKLSESEKDDSIRFRVCITPVGLMVGTGSEASLRVIKPDPMRFKEMRVEPYLIDAYKRLTDGLVFICGAVGNGKSSLLSGFICDYVESGWHGKIITYEAPIEIRYDKVLRTKRHNVILTQTEVPDMLPTFYEGTVNSLRRASQIAVVGESRDFATISASLEFAQTGGLLYTTLHVNNSIGEAIYRVVNMFPIEQQHIKLFEIIESVRLIVVQRLEKSLKGGRVAVREMLEFTPSIVAVLRSKSNLREMIVVLKELVQEHGISMSASAQALYDQGELPKDRLDYYLKLSQLDLII